MNQETSSPNNSAPGPSELAEACREFLEGAISAIGATAQVEVTDDSAEGVTLNLEGPDLGLLIGPQGETLNAFQTLIRAALLPKNPDRIPILLDAQGYRKRREEALQAQAKAMALKVRDTGQEAVAEGLSAYERRIVHLALADEPGIKSQSEGMGSWRRLVVSLAGPADRPKPASRSPRRSSPISDDEPHSRPSRED